MTFEKAVAGIVGFFMALCAYGILRVAIEEKDILSGTTALLLIICVAMIVLFVSMGGDDET